MSTSKSEKRFDLVQNWFLRGTENLTLTLNDIELSFEPNSLNGTEASFNNALSNFIKCGNMQQQQQGYEVKLLAIRQHVDPNFVDVKIKLEKSFLEWACSIHPKVFLEIRGSLTIPFYDGAWNNPKKFLERLELPDILAAVEKNGERELKRRLFYLDLDVDDELEWTVDNDDFYGTDCSFDITIGWQEAEEAKENAIKIGAESVLQFLLQNEETKDMTIVVGNGTEIKCHKMIFAAQSSVLSKMVSSGLKESKTGVVELRENSEDGVQLLLQYLYGSELIPDKLSCDLAVELFKTAHKYDLAHLQNSLSELLLKKRMDWFTPDAVLELYFYIRNLDAFSKLVDHSLDIMSRMNAQQLRSCEGFQSLDHNAAS